jgi:hypothetical protein
VLLLFSVFALSILAGYAFGGRLSRFESTRVRLGWLALIGLVLQELPIDDHGAAMALLMISYVALVVFAAANIRSAGFALLLVGLALNWFVIAVNWGMPVSGNALTRSGQGEVLQLLENEGGVKHHLATSEDDFLFLADVIPVGGPLAQVVSAGDILVYAGIGWYVVATMRGPRNAREEDGP